MSRSYDLLLINMVREYSRQGMSFKDSIGQHSIASYIEQYFFTSRVFSGNIRECKEVMITALTRDNVPIIGFYVASDNLKAVTNAIIWLKENYSVITVVGGPQAVALGKDFFRQTGNDFVIVGEGEIPVKCLLDHIFDKAVSLCDIPSLVYMEDGVLNINSQENSQIVDLDLIPHPSMEHSIKRSLRQGKMAGILTGRGCPFSCTFCYEGQTKQLRFRSVDHVMIEIDYIISNNKNLEYINVYDDTFTIYKERVLEFCEKIKKRNILWFCEGHVSFVLKHPEMLKIMVEHGLVCIQFGIESGSNQVLKAYQKQTTSDMIVEAVEICKNAGIPCVTGNFIIGGALETKETIEESKRLIKRLIQVARGCIDLHLVYFAPYPNTQISNFPDKFEISLNETLKDYSIHSMCTPVVSTYALDSREIYREMEQCRNYLNACYETELAFCTKSDLLQTLFYKKKRIMVNPTWEYLYFSKKHMQSTLEHLTDDQLTFQEDNYSIRTFDNFTLTENQLHTPYGIFEGVTMTYLLHANGSKNNREIQKLTALSFSQLEALFFELQEKCLLYLNDF